MEEKKSLIKYVKIILNLSISFLTILLVVWLGPKLLKFFMPFVIGWIIALIANPLVRFLEKRMKIVRKHSSALIIILVIGAVILCGYFLISKLWIEGVQFIEALPDLYHNIEIELKNVFERFSSILLLLPENTRNVITNFGNDISENIWKTIQTIGGPTAMAVGGVAKNIPNALIQVIVTILSSYFFIADRDKIMEYINKLMPEGMKNNIDLVYQHFKKVVGGYFKAQFRIMGIVALILLIGFVILRIEYAALLALLIAFLDFLPFFGTGTALIPWALIKFLNAEYNIGIWLIIIYFVSQLVRQMIQPKIVGDSMGLNPLSTLLFMYIGFKFRGIAGMILAVPIGLILIKLYEAGVFLGITENVKEIVSDINKFRKS